MRHLRRVSGTVACSLLRSSLCARRQCFSTGAKGGDSTLSFHNDLHMELQEELARDASRAQDTERGDDARVHGTPPSDIGDALHFPIQLEKLARAPAKFDLLTKSVVYKWQTTAQHARKVSGPMREWASELKYRTGVHMELEPTFPARLVDGDYRSADDVDITVYLFGSEGGIASCKTLMESALTLDSAYVRLALFRRLGNGDVEWLTLRRINRDLRPPDIPPISLKTPGKWTLLFEQYKEAAIRSLYEETGVHVEAVNVFPTGLLYSADAQTYWRPPVRYFIAELPRDAEVLGPQVAKGAYMRDWNPQMLRQSPDPMDRAWAEFADPATGCAWMSSSLIDELHAPLRGKEYMATRYTPPPYSDLQDVLRLQAGAPSFANTTDEIK